MTQPPAPFGKRPPTHIKPAISPHSRSWGRPLVLVGVALVVIGLWLWLKS